jgi:hypothetical protein
MKVRSILGEFNGRAISAYEVLNYKNVDVGCCRLPWLKMDPEASRKMLRRLAILGAIQ